MILVTGGAGFIGTNLVKFLLQKKHKVLVLDNLLIQTGKNNISPFKKNNNFFFSKGDIGNKLTVKNILKKYKPTYIINLAAETHVDKSIKDPNKFIKSNIVGVLNLLECSREYWNKLDLKKKKEFRFLHISTDEVFGSLKKNEKPFSEENKYYPSSPYSASKASADHLVNAWNITYKLPTLISNCSNNFGPYQYFEKLIPLTIINAINEKEIPVYGNGKQIRDWLFVNDHCLAIYKLLKKGKIGETYNIGGKSEKTNLETIKEICNYLDIIKPRKNKKKYKELITHVNDRPGHDERYGVSIKKINNHLNWKPLNNFKDSIKKTVDWYLLNQNWLSNSESVEFKKWLKIQYQTKN